MRPYIVCHMVQSVDGRIDCDMVDKISGDEYYSTLDSFDCPSKIEGKYSYQLHHCGFEDFKPETTVSSINEESFHIANKCDGYEISLDNPGILLWDNSNNNNRLCIVSEKVSVQYLDYLKQKGISYIATGKDKIDLPRAMEILYTEFGVKRTAVLGGGKINGAFLEAGLLDELSILVAPGIDGRTGQSALFDGISDNDFKPKNLILQDISRFDNGVVWLKYKFN